MGSAGDTEDGSALKWLLESGDSESGGEGRGVAAAGRPVSPVSYPRADHLVRIWPETMKAGLPAIAALTNIWRPPEVTSDVG